MIYKNISSKYIIAKVYRDLALNDPNYHYDMIEWIGEALDFIGSATQLERKEEILEIENYKTMLPQGLVVLNQLRYENPKTGWQYLKYNPGSFNLVAKDSPNYNANTAETYSLNPNHIITSFEDGTIEISYLTITVDEDGYPLVPDNQYFKEALFWYCFRQMMLSGYKSKITEINYMFADSKWKFYCTAARNQANYPDIGQYERFKDVWVGLIPAKNLFEKGYHINDTNKLSIETVNASNLITRPLTVESNDLTVESNED
jgi:hypothetical protein